MSLGQVELARMSGSNWKRWSRMASMHGPSPHSVSSWSTNRAVSSVAPSQTSCWPAARVDTQAWPQPGMTSTAAAAIRA